MADQVNLAPGTIGKNPQTTSIKVDHVLPEVAKMLPVWKRIRDCVEGQDAVKAAGAAYLPYLQPGDTSQDNVDRNAAYVERAVFYGVTKRTSKGLVGQVLAKPPVLAVPVLLENLRDSVDGGAVSFDQQAKQALSDAVGPGRAALFADYPNVAKSATRQDLLDGRVRPTIQYYFAEQIINWRVETIGAERALTLVVLREMYVKADDGFEKQMGYQYRVLRLVDGVFIVQVWQKLDSGNFAVTEAFQPRDGRGQPFKRIPFHFIGSDNNDPGIDDPPLLDMANLNIAHYRNSADFEEMVFMVSQPTPIFTGLTQAWVDEVWVDGVALGSRTAIPLPEGADAKLLQVNAETLGMEVMKHKEEQMKALGAKLVEPKTGQRTLGEAQMDEAEEASVLMTCATNVSDAYTKALRDCAQYLGIEVPETATREDFGYELNTDFEITRMGVEARKQLMAEWQAGAISFTEYRSILRRANIATQEDDEAQEEIDAQTEKDMQNLGNVPGTKPGDNKPPVDEE